MGTGQRGSIPVTNSVSALDQGRRILNFHIVGHIRVVVAWLVIPAIRAQSSFGFFLNKSDQNIISGTD